MLFYVTTKKKYFKFTIYSINVYYRVFLNCFIVIPSFPFYVKIGLNSVARAAFTSKSAAARHGPSVLTHRHWTVSREN